MRIEPLSRDGFPKTWAALEEGIANGAAPGAVVGAWSASAKGICRIAGIGKRAVYPTDQPTETGTVFDLASVTKVFATASLAAALVDRGWLGWETPIRELLPGFEHEGVRVRHLLAHTAGYPAWGPFWERLRERFAPTPVHEIAIEKRQAAMRELVLATPLEAPLESRALYSDVSFLALGFALEDLLGLPLDRAVSRYLWEPMGITGASYRRVSRDSERGRDPACAATENCPWRGVLQGQVHDDNCWAMGGYAGHAGAFARAEDLLSFAAALVGGFLSPATRRLAWARAARPPGCGRTLGWDTPTGPTPAAGSRFSRESVGHLGYTGTSLWIDPPAGIAVVLLTNRLHPLAGPIVPMRPETNLRENQRIREFRPKVHDAIREELGRC